MASEGLNAHWGPAVGKPKHTAFHPAMLSSWRYLLKVWYTVEGKGRPLQHSCLENPMNSLKRQKDMTLKDEPPRSVDAQYSTGVEWRNSYRKNEEAEPKWKRHPGVIVSVGESKVQCCKEQYCIGTWNVRSMKQGKLDVVKQEMARVNIDILGISEIKWVGVGVQPQQDPGEPSGWTASANERESETKLGAKSEVYFCTAPLYP